MSQHKFDQTPKDYFNLLKTCCEHKSDSHLLIKHEKKQ